MPWPDHWPDPGSLVKRLPAPPEDEPEDLRAAIADELADHLACATERERRRAAHADEAAIRAAVVGRFGDPARVARRLWLDAMKERLMHQRLVLVTNLVLALACVAICMLAYAALRQNARVNEALIARLDALPAGGAAPATGLDWTGANVHVAAADGSPMADCSVILSGRAFDGAADKPSTLEATTDDDGRASFGPIRPGEYWLRIRDAARRERSERLVLYPAHTAEVEVRWPAFDAAPREVAIRFDVPAELRPHLEYCNLSFLPRPARDGEPADGWRIWPVSVLVDHEGRILRLDEVPGLSGTYPMDHYYRQQMERARFDADRLVFADHITVDEGMFYVLDRITAYFADGGDDLAVVTLGTDPGFRHTGNGLDPPPPFDGSTASPWSVPFPESLAEKVRLRLGNVLTRSGS